MSSLSEPLDLVSCRTPSLCSRHEEPSRWCAATRNQVVRVETSSGMYMAVSSSPKQSLNTVAIQGGYFALPPFLAPLNGIPGAEPDHIDHHWFSCPLPPSNLLELKVFRDALTHKHPQPHNLDSSLGKVRPVTFPCAPDRDLTPPQLQALPNSSAALLGSLP